MSTGCCAFGSEISSGEDTHNDQVLRIVDLLGRSGDGRRAILRALAERQGITAEDDLEMLYSGKSEVKLDVPQDLRRALQSVGLGDHLAPMHILTAVEKGHVLPIQNSAWTDLEFEVALDSGSVVHVCAPDDCPGYRCEESPGNRRGQEFLVGDGGTIPNLGQSQLNLCDEYRQIQSVFQLAAVTRPLMSVGRI